MVIKHTENRDLRFTISVTLYFHQNVAAILQNFKMF